MMKNIILLPIIKVYSDEIFNGKKKYEYRKAIPKDGVDKILVYESRGCRAIVGELEVDQIIRGEKEELWEITREYGGVTKEGYDGYFNRSEMASAYLIKNAIRYAQPKTLAEFGITRAPQNYIWIDRRKTSSSKP